MDFSQIDVEARPVIVLKNLDGTALQTLGYAFNVECDLSFSEVSTLSFSLPAQVNGEPTPHYDEVVGMRIVELVSVGQFYLLDPTEESDGPRKVKTCKAYSLEYEFAKKNIYLEEGTYNFYDGVNADNKDTIVGRIREIMPDWSISVDSGSLGELVGRYRTFDDTNKKLYDFIKSDVQEKYGCIFDFDTMTRTVYIVSATAANDNVKKVWLSDGNLIKKIKIDEDSDGIVTCLDVYGDDDVDIRGVNPTGTNKIYNLDYFMTTENFSQSLIDKWHAWEAAVAAQRDNYYSIQMTYNMLLLDILMEENGLSSTNQSLSTLQNQQASIIQGISTGTSTQANLTAKNAQISTARTTAASAKTSIASKKTQAAALLTQMQEINDSLAMDAQNANDEYIYFTPEELAILRRYFIEDTIQDNSFVASSVATYNDTAMNIALSGATLSISSGVVTHPSTTTYRVKSGTATISTLSGAVTYANLETSTGNSFIMSVSLGRGTVGSATFGTGNIVVSGTYSALSTTGNTLSITVSSGRMYFTQDATEYQKHQVEWELLEYAESVLREKASPTYHFSVECANFLNLGDFAAFKAQLEFGKRIYLDLGERVYTPFVVALHLSYDDKTSCSVSFSDSYTSFDQSFSLAKLLEQSVSMGKTLNYKSGQYSAFVNSGASSEVKEFIDSALDISKNMVLSSNSQAISIDDTGVRIRKYKKDNLGDYILDSNGEKQYEPEEVWMTDSSVLFTDDNWATAKMAIGKIYRQGLVAYAQTSDTARNTSKTYYINEYGTEWDPDIHGAWSTDLYEVDTQGTSGYGYGIIADYLIGKMIVGQNMIIECPSADGQTILFKVDGSGASITNGTFTVTNGSGKVILSPDGGIGVGTTSMAYSSSTGWNSSTNFWVDTSGGVHLKGTLEGADGTFSGSLSAADGTFTGELSAATGTFSGTLSAAEGEFRGIVNAAGIYVNGQNILTNTSAGTGTNAGYQVAGNSSKISASYLDLGNIQLDGTGDGTVTIGNSSSNTGSLYLYGNIYMNGNITWGAGNSPVKVKYSQYNYSYLYYPSYWHDTCYSTDLYAVYSYDGGTTWTDPIKIRGEDGQDGTNGTNGSDASVTLQAIRNALSGAPDGIYTINGGQIGIQASVISTRYLQLYSQQGSITDYAGWDGYNYTSGIGMMYSNGVVAVSSSGTKMQFGNQQIYVNDAAVYLTGNELVTSDRRMKHNIQYDFDKYEQFYSLLKPSLFVFNNDTSESVRCGFIAQDVEEAMSQSGLGTNDFSAVSVSDDENIAKVEHQRFISYGEFIALNTYMIQKLCKRVEALEARLAAQE